MEHAHLFIRPAEFFLIAPFGIVNIVMLLSRNNDYYLTSNCAGIYISEGYEKRSFFLFVYRSFRPSSCQPFLPSVQGRSFLPSIAPSFCRSFFFPAMLAVVFSARTGRIR